MSRIIAVATVAGLVAIGVVVYVAKTSSGDESRHHHKASHHSEAPAQPRTLDRSKLPAIPSRASRVAKVPAETASTATTAEPAGPATGAPIVRPGTSTARDTARDATPTADQAAAIAVLRTSPHDVAALRTMILAGCSAKDQAGALEYYALLPSGQHTAIQKECAAQGTKLPGEKGLAGKTIAKPKALQ